MLVMKNWIVLKSTQIGLLKNVQDGISRPLGSREIQETKVATVLRDTLYLVVESLQSSYQHSVLLINFG